MSTALGVSPFFSIIIPTLNSAATLDAALESIACQDCRDFEVIVSDGVSTDGTLETASRYQARLTALTILSRPDDGVYDAINRAIAVARGRWVYVLGSDDRLHAPGVLSRFRDELASSLEPLVYGDVIVRGWTPFGVDGARYDGEFTLERLATRNICQQAMFYRRELFDRMGGFEQRYRVVADWHFGLRAFARHPTRWVDAVVCDFAGGGLSSREADPVFAREYPDVLLQILMASPLRRELASIRWILYRHALACRRQGRLTRAARFYAAFAWLGIRDKLSPARAEKLSSATPIAE
jgi:glycosyltransferase involved in cell wall biosynthesis